MSHDNQKAFDLTEVGKKLVGHSKSAEFTATHGLIIDLFPFVFEASERMSARAIQRFLEQEQGIKLSQVTISRALSDPKKSWQSYFKTLEPSVIIMAKWCRSTAFKFLFYSKHEFETRTGPDFESSLGRAFGQGVRALLIPDKVAAQNELLQKWFSIGLATRLKAKPYLEECLMALADKI